MNKEQYTNYAGSVYAGIVKLNTEGNNTLASEYGVAFLRQWVLLLLVIHKWQETC
jgi:hypothetical protein